MTTHSSILAWEIAWSEETGGVTESRPQLSMHAHRIRFLKSTVSIDSEVTNTL